MYVKWGNNVVKLRNISIQNYFDRRSNTKHNWRDFYKTGCPLLSDKPSSSNGKIILYDNGNIILDPHMLLIYSWSVSAYNGIPHVLDFEDDVLKHSSYESTNLIKQHTAPWENFRFKFVPRKTFKCYTDHLKSDKELDFMGCKQNYWNYLGTDI